MTPWHQRPHIIFDIESTGVERETDRIVTATVGLTRPGQEAVISEYKLDPGIEIPEAASAIHGITTENARVFGMDAAEGVAEIADRLETLLTQTGGEARPLVIYKAPFDLSMFDRECRRYGIIPLTDRAELNVVCPLTIDKALNPYVRGSGMRKLTPTCARYGIELKDAHNATADATATGALARALVIPQRGDSVEIKRRRALLEQASLADLAVWQRSWYEDQKLSLARYFDGKGGNPEAAASCRAEAPYFPLVPLGALAID